LSLECMSGCFLDACSRTACIWVNNRHQAPINNKGTLCVGGHDAFISITWI
jgi:hypothetical protein